MTSSDKSDRANFEAALLALGLDRAGAVGLQAQLGAALRGMILSGAARPGQRLPASRTLARDLGLSRATTLGVYDQLLAEGYVETRQGAGTFVAADLPPRPALATDAPPAARVSRGADAGRASGGTAGSAPAITDVRPAEPMPADGRPRPFDPGLPDMARFPHRHWARQLEHAWRDPEPALLGRADPLGWLALRAAIAAHLGAWRGMHCRAAQVFVTSGSGEAFDLLARLLPPAARVHVEAPCYGPMRDTLEAAGHLCAPLAVDDEGLDPAGLSSRAAAVVVTPSRQYPLGMTMPLGRRLALLDWAAEGDRLVIEDDYDSEFRFAGAPLPAMASLEPGRVVYVGSFSKLLSPTLRLGYVVLPAALVDHAAKIRAQHPGSASLVAQPALARFMETGDFAIHLRRMRRLYGQRQRHLLQLLRSRLDGWLVPQDAGSGMHLVCRPGERLDGRSDRDIAAAAQEAGIDCRALSSYPLAPEGLNGLVLGFSAFDEAQLTRGVEILTQVLTEG
ncbi:PLP-dependent aminotransferase family protein [Mesobaculum littorinae]|uniref:PLP-dependent aminotransferase family protein n=1 Tax=Mesobaculum littorinae TaxID=2486419 RepID=A0A438AJ88_9RHOB|nr:PLP-dependent aminotransferase family protein [Mesobaculum littorinae]RVV98851.1 PLP-dependent aminotransferase family protein [Mesobaculum littorinae]